MFRTFLTTNAQHELIHRVAEFYTPLMSLLLSSTRSATFSVSTAFSRPASTSTANKLVKNALCSWAWAVWLLRLSRTLVNH